MNTVLNICNIYFQAKASYLGGVQWGLDISILKTLQLFSSAARAEYHSVGWCGDKKNKSARRVLSRVW